MGNFLFGLLVVTVHTSVILMMPLLVASPSPGDKPITVEIFNELPKHGRLVMLESMGNEVLSLGGEAKVDDLIADVMDDSKSASSERKKIFMAYALVAIARTESSNDDVIDQCTVLADKLLNTEKFRLDGYEIYFHLLGNEARPILERAFEDPLPIVRVRAAIRFGSYIGTPADVGMLKEVAERESNGGSKTVAEYLTKAIDDIESRAKEKSNENGQSAPRKQSPNSKPNADVRQRPTSSVQGARARGVSNPKGGKSSAGSNKEPVFPNQ